MPILTATAPRVIRSFARQLPPVREPRRTAKPVAHFGAGILATRPTYSVPFALSDEAWYVEQLAAAEDRRYDEMEAEAIGLARVDMGLCF
ncbi:hypothetical protein SAMN05444166_0242 [Singulisphaera sp. GP187]|uniref:hypothetical protein n=1 Tax=Singulisphaera sp. GP187 TaxID=1882752 RepID=UPI0009285896|nr:hypothetical protein [Singulisphaera sp. GP187]SIN70194.1 hypothetical protein SAMN05444166_0242 [Singulisphaera sp. GP187]